MNSQDMTVSFDIEEQPSSQRSTDWYDLESFPIGYTVDGVQSLVTFSQYTLSRFNKPPVIFSIGEPGSGKTFLVQKKIWEGILSKDTAFVLDPKSDTKTGVMAYAQALGFGDRVQDFDVTQPGYEGVLDPIRMQIDDRTTIGLAVQVVNMLLPGLSQDDTNLIEAAARDAVAERSAGKYPSMLTLIDKIGAYHASESGYSSAGSLAQRLKGVSDAAFSNLFFARRLTPGETPPTPPSFQDRTTFVTMAGLPLPSRGEDLSDPSKIMGRVAVTVMFLLTTLIRREMILSPAHLPKTLYIDEAWVVFNNDYGQELIGSLMRLGRSRNAAIWLILQGPDDIDRIDTKGIVGTVFAFKMGELFIPRLAALLELNDVEQLSDVSMKTWPKGRCLMLDFDRRVAQVQISTFSSTLEKVFATAPDQLEQRDRAIAQAGQEWQVRKISKVANE